MSDKKKKDEAVQPTPGVVEAPPQEDTPSISTAAQSIIKEGASFAVADPGTQKSKGQTYGSFFEEVDNYLDLYRAMYDNVPIMEGAVNAYLRLTNPGYYIQTEKGDPNTIAITDEILNVLNFNEVLNDMIQQTLIYGFCGSEMVFTSDYSSILRIVPISSRQLRLKKDMYGNIVSYHQLGGWVMNSANNNDPFTSKPGGTGYNSNNAYRLRGSSTSSGQYVELDPDSMLYFNRKVLESNSYGRSLFRSLPSVSRQLLSINDAVVKIYSKYGSPKFHVKYTPAESLSQTKLTERLNLLKNSFAELEHGEDFFTAGDIEVDVVAPGQGTLKMNMEVAFIAQEIFSGLGLPAGVLGFNYGSTETHMKEQVQILLGNIEALQHEFARYINKQLMTKIAMIYGMSEVPKFIFKKPRVRDRQSEAVAEQTEINNVITLLEAGLITPEQAQSKLEIMRNS